MSIVALKRNSQRYISKVSHNQGSNGFALNGGLRNAGWVGQTSLGRIGSANSFCVYQDPSIVKKSVKNTLGVLTSTIRYPVSAGCTNGGCDPLHSSMNAGKKAAITDDHTASGQIANVINNAICTTLCSTSTASTPFGLFTGGPNTLPLLDGRIKSSFISNDGTTGYFGTDGGNIFKVDLDTMTFAAGTPLNDGPIFTSFISKDGSTGYFGTINGNIFKVNLDTMTFAPGTPLNDGPIFTSFISGTTGYFGTGGVNPNYNGSVFKVNLGNDAVASVCQCNNTNRVSVINNPTAFKSKLACPPAGCRAGSHHINGRFVYDTPYNKDVSSFSAMTAGDYIRRLKKPASFNTQFNESKTVRPYMLVNLPQGVIGNAASV